MEIIQQSGHRFASSADIATNTKLHQRWLLQALFKAGPTKSLDLVFRESDDGRIRWFVERIVGPITSLKVDVHMPTFSGKVAQYSKEHMHAIWTEL